MHSTYINIKAGVGLIDAFIVNKLRSISVVGVLLGYLVDYCWREVVESQVEWLMKWLEVSCYLFVDCTGIDNVYFKNRQRIVYNVFNYRTFKRFLLYIKKTGLSIVNTVSTVFKGALFAEREVFDLYGVRFKKHPDMRRILTDYGFVGHPFKKDYPLSGYMQMAFSSIKKKLKKEKLKLSQELRVFEFNMSWWPLYVEGGNNLVMVLFLFLAFLLICAAVCLKEDQRGFLARLELERAAIYGVGWFCTEKLVKDISRQNVSKLVRASLDKAIRNNWLKNDAYWRKKEPVAVGLGASAVGIENSEVIPVAVGAKRARKGKRAKEEKSEVTPVAVGIENSEVIPVAVGAKRARKGKRAKEEKSEVTPVAVGIENSEVIPVAVGAKRARKGKRAKEEKSEVTPVAVGIENSEVPPFYVREIILSLVHRHRKRRR
jgi:NADH:ubiquinone oxidoreductase subunit C